jgi:hypothetical protein
MKACEPARALSKSGFGVGFLIKLDFEKAIVNLRRRLAASPGSRHSNNKESLTLTGLSLRKPVTLRERFLRPKGLTLNE